MQRKGKVYIIGAGPGDWELITVKGLKIIKQADVILYDFLASKDLLKFAKKNAKIICVGKADGLHLKEQGEINSLLTAKAKEAKIVVRLKGGDPLLFSRGIEEALYLKKRGINFEIIPGLTSAFSAPASFGIPLTRKGRFSSVAVLTGRKSNSDPIDAPDCDTLIYLMALANITEVVKRIILSGRKRNTPCVLIERATTASERIVKGNLSNIEGLAKKNNIQSPAIFVVGKITELGEKIYGHKY